MRGCLPVRIYCLLCATSFFCLCPVFALQNQELPFSRLTIREGLSNSEISCFLKDRAGLLWIGTSDGLNRYDGDSFTAFKNVPGNNNSLGNNIISALAEDNNGLLWIATYGGLDCLDRKTMQFTHYRHDDIDPGSLINDMITSLMIDSADTLWIGTGAGLDRFERNRQRFYHYVWKNKDETSLSYNSVKSLYLDNEGVLWVGTEGGLNRYRPETDNFTRYMVTSEKNMNVNVINTMYEDKNRNFWLGTQGGGLQLFDRKTGMYTNKYTALTRESTRINGHVIWAMGEDSLGNFWVGTWNGWNLFDPVKGEFPDAYTFQRNNTMDLYKNLFTVVYKDNSGITWIGTADGIIVIYPPYTLFRRCSTGTANPELLPDPITSFCEDADKRLWIATQGRGVKCINRETGRIVSYRHDPALPAGLPDNNVQALCTDQAGIVWIGTEKGLCRFDEDKQVFIRAGQDSILETALAGAGINAFYEDREHKLWIATEGRGLCVLEQKTEQGKIYRHDPSNPAGLSHNTVYALFEDRAGTLWTGTEAGLDRFDRITGQFNPCAFESPDKETPAPGRVQAVFEDSTGRLWAGTEEAGLFCYNRQTDRFSPYIPKKRRLCESVYAIREDKNSNLWISTEQGLCRLNPATGQFALFDESHGLPAGSFNPGAAYSSRQGELFFGTTTGFCSFLPETLDPGLPDAPDVILTSFKQDGKAVSFSQFPEQVKKIGLYTRTGSLDFTFAANASLCPQENQYAYRLAGYDTEWHYCGTTGRGSYRNLPNRNYTLELKSSSQYGYWNGKTTVIRITFSPIRLYAWQVLTGILGIVGLTAAIFIAIAFIQSRQLIHKKRQLSKEKAISEGLRKLDKLKDEFLANTSHELRTPLNGMINLAESLLQTPGMERGTIETLGMIAASGRRLSNLINDILDFSRLKTGNLEIAKQAVDVKMLAEFVLKLCRALTGNKNLALENLIDDNIPRVQGDEERIQQILFNLVGNAVKFTEKGSVQITAAHDEEKVVITVADTGSGIPEDKLEEIFEPFKQGEGSCRGTGLGLYITKQLIILHGGSIRVESRPGRGARFSFSLPVFKGMPGAGEKTGRLPEFFLPADKLLSESYAHNNQHEAEASTLLIIDDEPVNQYVLAGQLEDYHLLHAYDGAAGLQMLESGRKIDLVLLDLMLPGMDGWEVCRRIRSRFPAYALPVIMITARNQAADLVSGLAAGANDYLAKPFLKDELTARVKTQLNLARYDLLKEITEQKTQFFINLAHETRTPLTLISNYLDGYIKKHGIDDELKGIKSNLEKLTADIMNFLDYEKLAKGQVFYDHNQVNDLSEILNRQLVLFRELALHKGIQITSQITAGLHVKADQAALERIINNLLDNAVKFTVIRETGDKKRIEVILECRGDKLLLVVKDNGIGIPAGAREHIFEKYYQVSHKKRSTQGNGMGLALVAVLVQQLKGTITVESGQHQGSCFTVTLLPHHLTACDTVPVYTALNPLYDDGESTPLPGEENIRPGKFNILIVEDKIELSACMQSRMKDKYNIYLAFNGKEALHKLQSIPCPDLIVSDIMMDEMDGYTLFQKLSEREEYRTVPFMIMTARGSLDEKIRSLHSGVLDYIYKPFLIDELQARIDSLIRYEQMRKNLYERDKYAALGILLSGIAHELLNPLSGITGPIGNLRRYLEQSGKNEAEPGEYLAMMEKNTKRISGLVKNLKSLYYQDEVKKEAIDFEKIIHSITELFSNKIKDRITIQAGVDADFTLTANPGILSHILINLVSNAIDSIQDRGVIRILAAREDAAPVIRVSDTGMGMSREIIANIFHPFYTTKSDYRGLGLGLFIVKDLVMRMGWELMVNSEPGKGSEFVIRING